MPFVVINRHPYGIIFCEKLAQKLQSRRDHRQPLAMLEIVIVMIKRTLGIVRWIDQNAPYAPRVIGQ